MEYALGIIGAGNMAEAIARGVISGGLLKPSEIIAADPALARRELFHQQLQIRAVENIAEAASDARQILLSVKPQQMAQVLSELSAVLSPRSLLISIAAGISTSFIESRLGQAMRCRVVRAMPNTPLLVGAGMVALTRGKNAGDDDVLAARSLFTPETSAGGSSTSEVIEIPESLMDAVTAVSGSGPAYFFLLAEKMIEAGIALGLTPVHARQLTAQTALGAAKMLATLADSPEELRDKVTSPGGTTQAAISHLESQGVPAAIMQAVKAAADRSKELGR